MQLGINTVAELTALVALFFRTARFSVHGILGVAVNNAARVGSFEFFKSGFSNKPCATIVDNLVVFRS